MSYTIYSKSTLKETNTSSDYENDTTYTKKVSVTNRKTTLQTILPSLYNTYSHITFFDLIVDLTSVGADGQSNYNTFEARGFDFLHSQKPIRTTVCRKSGVSFLLPLRDGVVGFQLQKSIQMLECLNSPIHSEFARKLRNIEGLLIEVLRTIEQTLKDTHSADFHEILKEREQYLNDIVENLLEFELKDKFVNIAVFSPCFSSKTMQISRVVMSRQILKLLGENEEHLIHLAMKKNKLDCFTLRSRYQLQNVFLDFLITKQTIHQVYDFELATSDDIVITCPVEFRINVISFPADKQFSKATELKEIMMTLVFDITDFHLRKINGIRRQTCEFGRNYDHIQQPDLEYLIHSEMFIQKYYAVNFKKTLVEEAQEKIIFNEQRRKTCKYRPMQQQITNTSSLIS